MEGGGQKFPNILGGNKKVVSMGLKNQYQVTQRPKDRRRGMKLHVTRSVTLDH